MFWNGGERSLLGTVLVRLGAVTRHDVESALAVQAENGRKLGEILVQWGVLSRPGLERALAVQAGADLDIEGGFGSGLRAAIERNHVAGK